jgi:hypothetical protein
MLSWIEPPGAFGQNNFKKGRKFHQGEQSSLRKTFGCLNVFTSFSDFVHPGLMKFKKLLGQQTDLRQKIDRTWIDNSDGQVADEDERCYHIPGWRRT